MDVNGGNKILIIEPFYGGSHKQLVDLLRQKLNVVAYCLPAKKWHWRARTSSLYFSQTVPQSADYTVLFTSSVLNLAELVALRPDLGRLKKILYFHENQLVYPVRKQQNRDFQYGYNQVLSCLVADVVLFNSSYNQESFLNNISTFLKLIPDHRPTGLADQIRPKCKVLYFPLVFPTDRQPSSKHLVCHQTRTDEELQTSHSKGDDGNVGEDVNSSMERDSKTPDTESQTDTEYSMCGIRTATDTGVVQTDMIITCKRSLTLCVREDNSQLENQDKNGSDNLTRKTTQPLHIVWAHRWEHDKDPETFFHTLYRLHDDGLAFKVSVMGEMFTDVPDIFIEAESRLSEHIVTWGYQDDKGDYSLTLQSADVAVSTALHEFFGVAMLEAVYFGCYPLCPDRLVYPEIFPAPCLYRTPTQLYKRLREFCRRPHLVWSHKPQIDINRFMWETLHQKYEEILCKAQ